MIDDIQALVLFSQVASAGGFSAAARRLGLPKSRLSRKVAELEEALGVRLLERTTRAVRLTEVGRRLAEHARRISEELSLAEAEIVEACSEPAGRVRVTAPVALGRACFGSICAEYLSRYPRVELVVDLTNRWVDLIEENYDLAIRAGTLPDSSLVLRRLGIGRRGLFAAPAYLERSRIETLGDLLTHPLLDNRLPTGAEGYHLKHGGEERLLPVAARMYSNDVELVIAAAIAGQGVAVLPSFVAEAPVSNGQLRRVLPEWDFPTVDINALYPSRRGLTPAGRAFLDLVAQCLPPMLVEH